MTARTLLVLIFNFLFPVCERRGLPSTHSAHYTAKQRNSNALFYMTRKAIPYITVKQSMNDMSQLR